MMKRILLLAKSKYLSALVAILMFGNIVQAQQLLTNGNFETYKNCPRKFAQISETPGQPLGDDTYDINDEFASYGDSATGWIKPSRASSDYANICNWTVCGNIFSSRYDINITGAHLTDRFFEGVFSQNGPSGICGQRPGSNGYVGLYVNQGEPGTYVYSEYIQQQLKAPLVAGKTYTFTFIAARAGADDANFVLTFGAVFTPTAIRAPTNGAADFNDDLQSLSLFSNWPSYQAVASTSTLAFLTPAQTQALPNDKWSAVQTITFTAKGGEKFITIGASQNGGPTGNHNYIVMDDASVQLACETAVNNTSNANICSGSTKTLSATPAGGVWSIVNGGGSITGTTYTAATVSAATSVTLRYTIAATSSCPATTADVTFTVDAGPIAINNTNTAAICAGATKDLSGAPAGGTWSVVSGGGTISGTTYTAPSVSTATLVTIRYSIAASGSCAATTADITFTVNPLPGAPMASVTMQPTCSISTGTITVASPAPGAGISYTLTGTNPVVSAVTNSTGIFAGLSAGVYAITTTNAAGCESAAASLTVNAAPSGVAPTLSAQTPAVCDGTTYTVTFTSNGNVTANAGVVMGNTVTGVPGGTNVTLTATSASGCASTMLTVVAPSGCGPTDCDKICKDISATKLLGVPAVSGAISYTWTATNGAIIASGQGTNNATIDFSASTGLVQVCISANNASGPFTSTCLNFTVSSTPPVPTLSVTQPTCSVNTGTVSVATPAPATGISYTITGTSPVVAPVTNTTGIFSGLAPGNYIVTASNNGCTSQPQTVIIDPASVTVPFLITQSPLCNGSTYSVAFSSNGTVTASAGTVSGNMVTGIPVGTNVSLTATNNCGSTNTSVTAPTTCAPTNCITPTLSVGQGVCEGTGTYSVAFNASAGAVISTTAGTVSGNRIINIPIAGNVTITATSATGTCNTSITVTKPADCSTPCVTPGASFSAGICTGTSYNINISNPNGATISATAGTVGANAITGIPLGVSVTITVKATGCTSQIITINPPSVTAPLLTTQSPVCNGTSYSVAFNSNGIVTASAGTISGNTVINIPLGTSITLTATSVNGCATTIASVTAPASCTPAGCITPALSAGQAVCAGTGFYSVAFNASAGAVITTSAGTVSGNSIINIPIAGNVTITATSATGTCNTSITVNKPADCSTPCATPGVSFSAGICSGTTYSINFVIPAGATGTSVTASVGTVGAGIITGIPIGTNVTVNAIVAGCVTQSTIISSPSPTAPLLTTQSPVCNGTTYSVAFSSNGTVSASAGTVSGSMVINIPVGTDLTLTATSVNGCATTIASVKAPANCTPTGCITPTLSAGQGVCTGTGTYSVAFNATAGAIISTSAGTVSGNSIINIPIAGNVTITATSATGTCNTNITVTKPADCSTPCATPGVSFSAGICNGATYSINFFNANTAANTITASAGTVGTNAITGIPVGTNVNITVTSSAGCAVQAFTINSPSTVAPLLITQSPVCNGTTYSVAFSSNGNVTASAGTVSGNTVINIPVGTDVTITAASANGCATTVATVKAPTNCTPTNCVIPTLSAGQGVCAGSGTYSVAFNASAGAVISTSLGTVSGSSIINIPIGSNVTITATSATGSCNTSITVTRPADCSTPCSTPGVSFSAGICNGSTYSINFVNPNSGTTSISASAGIVGANAITNIPVGTNVTVTATAAGCAPQVIIINSPSVVAPFLTTQSPVCNGTTYSVAFSSNGIVTASAGNVSGNMVINIPVGTNVTLTATSVNGCATTIASVTAPANCTPTNCITPTLSAGQGVCTGAGFYAVAFNASAGAVISTTAGTVSGNTHHQCRRNDGRRRLRRHFSECTGFRGWPRICYYLYHWFYHCYQPLAECRGAQCHAGKYIC